LVGAINAKSALTGVTAANTNNVLTLTASDGRNITLSGAGAGSGGLAGVTAATTYGQIKLSTDSSGAVTVKAGSANGTTFTGLTAGAQTMTAGTVTGQTVSSVDISSQSGAQNALNILDTAINTVTNSRANLGAYQNRFSAAISNLETTSTNLQASRSRILDTDYAKETTMLAKSQIVTQAATAMLAQANQSAQSVLALLK
jgi:flagellin